MRKIFLSLFLVFSLSPVVWAQSAFLPFYTEIDFVKLNGPVTSIWETIIIFGSPVTSSNIIYNHKGHAIKSTSYEKGLLMGRKKETLNVMSSSAFSYDTYGKLIKSEYATRNQNIHLIYDGKHRLIEERTETDGYVYEKKQIGYDQEGKKISVEVRRLVQDQETLMEKKTYALLNERCWEETGFHPKDPVVKKVYCYDEKKRLVKESNYKIDGKIFFTYINSYKDDKYGNWIEQRKERFDENGKLDKNLTMIVTRKIRYYGKNDLN